MRSALPSAHQICYNSALWRQRRTNIQTITSSYAYGGKRKWHINQTHPMINNGVLQDIIREIEQKSEGGGYIYRGERECHEGKPYYGKVSSSLWREYRIDNEHFDVETRAKRIAGCC